MKDINKIRLLVLLSGFISMELELLGTRLLQPVFGPTIYVWTSLIGVTLAFLALGYWQGGKLADKGKIDLNKLGLITLLLGIYICFLPLITTALIQPFSNLGILFGPIFTSLVILAFPIFFLGFVVPTSVKLATHNLEKVGKEAGEIYALATVGSIIGTLATGFFLILYIGISKTSIVTGAVLILLSLFIFKRKKPFFLFFLVIPILLFLFIPKAPAAVVYSSNSGYYSGITVTSQVIGNYNVSQLILDNVVQDIKTDNPYFFNYINFFKIPFYFRNISSTLMIGLGSGQGVQMLHDAYNVSSDVVEIDPRMVYVSQKYFGFNASNYNITINDARSYLLHTSKKYDLIISDLGFVDVDPYLFTTNFYEIIKSHLNPNGIFMINLVTAKEGSNSIIAESVYSDLKKEFDYVLVFRNPDTPNNEIDNTFFVASNSKIDIPTNLTDSTLDSIIQSPFTYNQTLSADTDNFAPIEKSAIKIRGAYFSSQREYILDYYYVK